ncbi:MAG: hypothetical protein JWO83_4927 [Caulobacteraceae bacterium]|jgi:hypothetical protein|nr:hypothetical protein [Caulobacteraceae bacterium]
MFQGWDSFFQITGSAAATLTGLLFVVVTLTERRDRSRMLRAVSIYLTPTVLHFAVVLSISALAVAPRLGLAARVVVVGAAALTGLGNGIWACIGMARRTPGAEPPHWSDFWLYGVAPTALYAALLVVAVALWGRAVWSAHAMAVLLVALLLLGIRNGWDLITWMAPARGADPGAPDAG